MIEHISQVLWILDRLISLIKIFIWPAFLWFFTKRPDVQSHIERLLSREWHISLPGAKFRVLPAEGIGKLPSKEKERVFPRPARLPKTKSSVFIVKPESSEELPREERERLLPGSPKGDTEGTL